MTGPVFVDTNVLVYDRDRRDARKHDQAQAWMTALWRQRGRGVVSTQVLTECYGTGPFPLNACCSHSMAWLSVYS